MRSGAVMGWDVISLRCVVMRSGPVRSGAVMSCD